MSKLEIKLIFTMTFIMLKIQLTNLKQATYVYHVSPSFKDL